MRKTTVERNEKLLARYNELLNDFGYDEAVHKVSVEFDLVVPYIKNLLKKNNEVTPTTRDKRNEEIIDLYMKNKDVSEISDKFDLTPTRVSQIIKDKLGKQNRNIIIEKSLADLRTDVENGMTHKEIVTKYGNSLLRKIKTNLGYNVFDACVNKRNDMIAQASLNGNTADDIAEQFGLTRDHVYSILHARGIRKKPDKNYIHDRNRQMLQLFKSGYSSRQIADDYGMTVTNVNIILKNNGARD